MPPHECWQHGMSTRGLEGRETLLHRPLPDVPETLTLALGSWEGPLDLLLTLARSQRVDLTQISILALVDQYLAFVAEARTLRLELAADYLVMAAWLAYLKSCLLLPADPEADPDPHELALELQWRLQRLDAMRDAGSRLMAQPRLGRDSFRRAAPEGLRQTISPRYESNLFELMAAYGSVKARQGKPGYAVARRPVLALDEAIERLEAMLHIAVDWTDLVQFMPAADHRDGAAPASRLPHDNEYRRSERASLFAAALELTRQGRIELMQPQAFAPLMLRACA